MARSFETGGKISFQNVRALPLRGVPEHQVIFPRTFGAGGELPIDLTATGCRRRKCSVHELVVDKPGKLSIIHQPNFYGRIRISPCRNRQECSPQLRVNRTRRHFEFKNLEGHQRKAPMEKVIGYSGIDCIDIFEHRRRAAACSRICIVSGRRLVLTEHAIHLHAGRTCQGIDARRRGFPGFHRIRYRGRLLPPQRFSAVG